MLDGPRDRRINKCRNKCNRHTPCADFPHTECADYIEERDSCWFASPDSKRNSCCHDGKEPYSPPHAERLPRLSAGGDDPPRTPHGNGAAGLSFLRLQPHRHARPGIPGNPHRQGGRRDRQADLSLPGRTAGGGSGCGSISRCRWPVSPRSTSTSWARLSNAITSPRYGAAKRPQAGRFREFMQCDFDTIGTRSTASDIETALVIHDLLRAIGIRDFTIRLNNRMLLTGLLERQGLVERSRLGAPRIGQTRQDRAGQGR